MPELTDNIINKTVELEQELKNTGLWQKEMPVWVNEYDDSNAMSESNFAQWLQFVFVPNHLKKNSTLLSSEKYFMVPHAINFFGDDLKKGKLLQILIEIDSLR